MGFSSDSNYNFLNKFLVFQKFIIGKYQKKYIQRTYFFYLKTYIHIMHGTMTINKIVKKT